MSLDGDGPPGDAGQTERGEAEAAVDEPGVVDQVEQEGENQEVAEAFRVAAGVENRVMGLVDHEEDSAVEHRPHIGYGQLQVCPVGAEQAEHGRHDQPAGQGQQQAVEKAEADCLGGVDRRLVTLPCSEGMPHQGGGAGGDAAGHGNDQEKEREREGDGGHGLGGDPPGIPGVHHVEHGVEEEADTDRNRQLAQQRSHRVGEEVMGGAHQQPRGERVPERLWPEGKAAGAAPRRSCRGNRTP